MNYKLISLLILSFHLKQSLCVLNFEYHSYDELTDILKSFIVNYPTKAYLYSIGKSVQNRELWVLAIADSEPDKHVSLR